MNKASNYRFQTKNVTSLYKQHKFHFCACMTLINKK